MLERTFVTFVCITLVHYITSHTTKYLKHTITQDNAPAAAAVDVVMQQTKPEGEITKKERIVSVLYQITFVTFPTLVSMLLHSRRHV